ncbi:hypothetical protein [Ancylobacter vacuolatus]|uniref:MBL fold metallo-hydrolase n=1 Tax=Ancylobacter vacuolatus TaxID=223389 RepID=A0ABU0DGF8_9HYPH|nr:hypothetical protein [Ancylobacter vacuolatus]MDQ0347335.1 hypothetical protein [Ancylobacter vacuolatus]
MTVDTHLIWGAHGRAASLDPWREMAAANLFLHLPTIAHAGHCPMTAPRGVQRRVAALA